MTIASPPNRARVENRDAIDGLIATAFAADKAEAWLAKLKAAGHSVRADQHGGACARRSAHGGAADGRDGRASDHRGAQDARHSVQVLRHARVGAARAADPRSHTDEVLAQELGLDASAIERCVVIV